MSRRNALSKQLAEYNTIESNEKVIDFANIDTLGNAPTMNFGNTIADFSDDKIEVDLNNIVVQDNSIEENYFIVLLVNETKEEMSLTTESKLVQEQTIFLEIPANWENTDSIHAIPLITDSKTAVTNFGSFIIKVRPEKKSN
jgi:hypothetical protein